MAPGLLASGFWCLVRRKGHDAGWKMLLESRGGINLSPSRVLVGNLWEKTCLVTILCVLARGDNYSGRGSVDVSGSFPLKRQLGI